jgi:hypothetical protein
MSKNIAMEMAEKYKALATKTNDVWQRKSYLNSAKQYYVQAGRQDMAKTCK